MDFGNFEGSDAKSKEVLRDVKNAIMSMQEAEAQGKAGTPNVIRYFSPLRAATVSDSALNHHKQCLTITGTLKDYRPTVNFDAVNRAQVTYCEDERKAYDKVVATGEVKKTTPVLEGLQPLEHGAGQGLSG